MCLPLDIRSAVHAILFKQDFLVMPDNLPPTMDSIAAARWQTMAPLVSPWLHEEVGRRMQERLQWICRTPQTWCDWQPVRGGMQTHALVAQRYPQANCWVVESQAAARQKVLAAWSNPWWSLARWREGKTTIGCASDLPAAGLDMLWANMQLHHQANPMQLLRQWHDALAVDGFVMFSCLGPDTLKELRTLYANMGWPAASHDLTDMHDWGDMLVQAGFAEPVMDMETIVLTFTNAPRLLQELRELGRNLHPRRFCGLRGRTWKQQLCEGIARNLAVNDDTGSLTLTFEIVYGHAIKPELRVPVSEENSISLTQMREMLRQRSA